MKEYKYQKDLLNDDENLSWCRPYISDRVSFAMQEGEIISLLIDGEEISNPKSEDIHRAALIAVEDYDLYKGYTDDELLVNGASNCCEAGCKRCPWYGICDAMLEEIEINE